jgi:hypothetical protein
MPTPALAPPALPKPPTAAPVMAPLASALLVTPTIFLMKAMFVVFAQMVLTLLMVNVLWTAVLKIVSFALHLIIAPNALLATMPTQAVALLVILKILTVLLVMVIVELVVNVLIHIILPLVVSVRLVFPKVALLVTIILALV